MKSCNIKSEVAVGRVKWRGVVNGGGGGGGGRVSGGA